MMRAAWEDDATATHRCGEGSLADRAHALFVEQQREWNLLRDNVAAVAAVRTRSIAVDDFVMRVQFNPARMVSTGASVDAHSIRQRKCFLCDENRPPVQRGIGFETDYLVLANPFPIFPEHLTIPHRQHRPQRIGASLGAMLDLAQALAPRYTVFYNGPQCGASAPDHLHFQAGNRRWMPIENEYDQLKGPPLAQTPQLRVFAPVSQRAFVAIESSDRSAMIDALTALVAELATIAPADPEPMMNILAWFEPAAAGQWRVLVLPRARHRPGFYYAQEEQRIMLSPGTVDLGGVCITPLERDFNRLSAAHLRQMLDEVMLPADQLARLRSRLAMLTASS